MAGVSKSHAPQFPRERFDRTISYYLDCLEEAGGYVARDFLGNEGTTFLELPLDCEWCLSGNSEIEMEANGVGNAFAREIRKRRGGALLYYGYPLFVDWIEKSARTGWTGGFAIPVFLQPIEHELHGDALILNLLPEWPRLNPKFAAGTRLGPEERRYLLESVGLLDGGEDPPEEGLGGVVRRMSKAGDWAVCVETLDPDSLQHDPPIRQLRAGGLYNRAIVILGERSPYTRGLEYELPRLRDKVADEELAQSAVKLFFTGGQVPETPSSPEPTGHTPVEVVPLNDEQRSAVRSAFENDLTVVTGPPGTGKSQVVLSVLANAFLGGQRVLFASYNHKAVDVVETRMNGLADHPLLIRAGRRSRERDLRAELLHFLSDVLSVAVTDYDRTAEADARVMVETMELQRQRLWERLDVVRKVRNSLDRVDQKLSAMRTQMPDKLVEELDRQESIPAHCDPTEALKLVDEHMASGSGLLHKLRVFLRRRKDFSAVERLARSLAKHTTLFARPPDVAVTRKHLKAWHTFLQQARARFGYLKTRIAYRDFYKKLASLPTSADFAEKLAEVEEKLWHCGQRLIAAYGRTLPDRLAPETRQAIGEYRATLERLTNDRVGGRVYARLMGEQRKLFRRISEVIPAWCVVNLSARGALPFAGGIFDLLVIDEASQCDIPSAMPLLFRARRAMIIGDPNQLRHIAAIDEARDQQLQARNGLTSAAEMPYTYQKNSLYDLAAHVMASSQRGRIIDLRQHFRSHADIVAFSNKRWYQGRLEICTDYRRLLRGFAGKPGIRWTDVRGDIRKPASGGALSIAEATAVVDQVESLLLSRGFSGTVGVVTPFRAQKKRILDLLNERLDVRVIERADLLVDTANGFQGDERDVMFFSPCVGPQMPRGARWFLASTGNLFNVAITRARALLHVVGDQHACLLSQIPHVKEFAQYVNLLEKNSNRTHESYKYGSDPRVGHWEQPFYKALVRAGLKPMPQYPEHQYRLDLAIKRGDFWLDIEIDGEMYHKEWDGTRCHRDVMRDLRLTALGWHIKRFWVYRIRDEMHKCVAEVADLVSAGVRP